MSVICLKFRKISNFIEVLSTSVFVFEEKNHIILSEFREISTFPFSHQYFQTRSSREISGNNRKLVYLAERSRTFQVNVGNFAKLDGHVGNTGTGKLHTGAPVFEISVYYYEKYR